MISFIFLNWYLLNKFWAIFPVSVNSSIVVIDEFGKEIDNAAVQNPMKFLFLSQRLVYNIALILLISLHFY